jgi:hypothetical protein
MLGLKSFALFLSDAHPHFEFEINSRLAINIFNISGTFDLPVGLDGNYRRSAPSTWGINPGHMAAAKGTWLNGQTFELDAQDLGFGGMSKFVLSFNGRKLSFTRTDPWGRTVSLDGEQAN